MIARSASSRRRGGAAEEEKIAARKYDLENQLQRRERGTELERESEVLERESGVKLYKNKNMKKETQCRLYG